MMPQKDDDAANGKQRLIISAHLGARKIELEFMATAEEENLEDKLAYLSEQPEILDERDFFVPFAAALRVVGAASQVAKHRHIYRRGRRLPLAVNSVIQGLWAGG